RPALNEQPEPRCHAGPAFRTLQMLPVEGLTYEPVYFLCYNNRFPANHCPPPQTIIPPFMKLAASEQRKTAAFSISAILPKRPRGIPFLIRSFIASGTKRVIPSVSSIGPGAIALTRI